MATKKTTAKQLSAAEEKQIKDALNEIFAGRTSAWKVAEGCLKVWKAVSPRKSFDNEEWARYTEGYGE